MRFRTRAGVVLSLALGSLAFGCTFEAPGAGDVESARSLSQQVQVQNLMPWVERLVADHLADVKLDCADYPSAHLYPSCELSRDRAAALVQEQLLALGYDARTVRQGRDHHVALNVSAEQRGQTRAGEVVLIAAHFDAFYGGADDNSSGVAVLLEVARVAAAHKFARTVRFVGFDLEERGALGSERYVDAGLANDVVAAFVLESVGYADHTKGSQRSPPGLPLGDIGDSLIVVANGDSRALAQRMLAINHRLELMPVRATVAGGDGAYFFTGPLLRSDNGPFWLRGLPAVMLTDSADYRNPHYHRPSDLPATLDPLFLGNVARLVAATLAVVAEVVEP